MERDSASTENGPLPPYVFSPATDEKEVGEDRDGGIDSGKLSFVLKELSFEVSEYLKTREVS